MANINAEIKMQGNNDAWFTANASEIFEANIQIFHVDGRYKFTDGVTALSSLPFLGSTQTLAQVLSSGNKTGGLNITSDNGENFFTVNDFVAQQVGTDFAGKAGYTFANKNSASISHQNAAKAASVNCQDGVITFTATDGVVLPSKEDSANKATTMTGNTTSNIVFLTAKAIFDWATSLFTPKTRNITINGTSQDLSADRTFNTPVPFVHVGTANLSLADNIHYYFGLQTLGGTSGANFTPPNIRGVGSPKTGTIKTFVLSMYIVNGSSVTSELVDFRLRNHTTATTHVIGSFTFQTTGNVVTRVITGLNIPITLGDECSSVYLTPNFATNPTGTYMVATYLIE